jgi:hypothetical protein
MTPKNCPLPPVLASLTLRADALRQGRCCSASSRIMSIAAGQSSFHGRPFLRIGMIAVLAGLPSAITEELDPGAVHQQVQFGRTIPCTDLFRSGNSWNNPAHSNSPSNLTLIKAAASSDRLGAFERTEIVTEHRSEHAAFRANCRKGPVTRARDTCR